MGRTSFKYYPTGQKTNELKQPETSFAGEVKFMQYYTKGQSGANQVCFQARVKYSYDWKASNEVGVVGTPRSNGLVVTNSMIVDPPSVKPTLSPAVALMIYRGTDLPLYYAPAIFYDFTGTGKNTDGTPGNKNPSNGLQRLRFEGWIFLSPSIKDYLGIRLGVAPYVSMRTHGTDSLNATEVGGILSIKFGTTFQQFF